MSDKETVYLDNAATTCVAPEVFEAMKPFFCENYGNPATMYELGRNAAEAVERAREQVARLIGADAEEIYFTSGGTESDNWALSSTVTGQKQKKRIITSAIEHHAVLHACQNLQKKMQCVSIEVLPVDSCGQVSPEALKEALDKDDTALVSIMHANNEIGTVEPIAELAAIAREKGVPFHTDAVQTVGKIPVDVKELGVDMLSISGHKIHGPKGIGALYLKKGTKLAPMIHGGGQERSRRAGTTNTTGVVGMGVAASMAMEHIDSEQPRQRALLGKLWQGLSEKIIKIRRNGDTENNLPGMLNITIEGIEGEAMLLMLDMHGICVSSGSACTTGSLDPSHVLLAIGLPAEIAHGSLRFSLSRYTTDNDIERVIEVLPGIVNRLREMSPTWKG